MVTILIICLPCILITAFVPVLVPLVLLVLFLSVRLTSHLYSRGTPPYVMNLDPACREVPYPANIDIRDTVNYKQGT